MSTPLALPPGVSLSEDDPVHLLLSARTGVVRFLRDVPVPAHMPIGFRQIASGIARTAALGHASSDAQGAGYAIDDPEAALGAALGEAVERYCGFLVTRPLHAGSAAELGRRADLPDPVEPTAWALFSDEQHAEPGFPFARFAPEHRTRWTEADRVGAQGAALVPAAMAWAVPPPGCGTPLHGVLQAGLAAGRTREAAIWSGLCEVIERDAMALGWYGRTGLVRLGVGDALERLAAGPEGRLRASWWRFPHPFGPPVIGALLEDLETGRLALGMGCRATASDAARKALGEAGQLLMLLDVYDAPDGPFAAAARGKRSPLKPWRADRAYAKSYGPDCAGALDYGCHLQLALDAKIRDAVRAELVGEEGRHGTQPLVDGEPATPASTVAALADVGIETLAVDLTTADVRRAGMHVVRVLAPGMIGNSAVGRPHLGSARLRAALGGDLGRRRLLPLPH